MGSSSCEACGGRRPDLGRCRCGARAPGPCPKAAFEDHELDDDFLGSGGDLELDRGFGGTDALAIEIDTAGQRSGRDRRDAAERRAAAAEAGFGDPSAGPLGAFLYALNASFRLPRLERARGAARRSLAAARQDVVGLLAALARALVADAHRREMALLADYVGALYATAGRAAAAGQLPREGEQEVARVREAVRARLQRARASMPDPAALESDGLGGVPAALLARASVPGGVDDAWIRRDGAPLPSGPVTGDPLEDLGRALEDFGAEARFAGLAGVADAATHARVGVERIVAEERRVRVAELAPGTLDDAVFARGRRLLWAALGLVAAMFVVIGALALVAPLRQ